VFLIRQSKPEDVPTLLKLARMVYFINLPPDERLIEDKIQHSQRCFRRVAAGAQTPAQTLAAANGRKSRRAGKGGFAALEEESDLFMFTIEDMETGGVIGTSQVRAHQGGPGDPNWGFKISEKRFYSASLGQGTTHTVGQLYGDETGPSEIGGLILQPSHRGHRLRPGRFISFVRFHFMGLHRPVFSERIIAEMMPPVSSSGDNIFWDAFGRKFIPVKYAEADRFCQHNRKFISELLPKEEIYLTLLPLEVQNMVGVVSRETIPARRMLESLGFAHRGIVDPFDGGPHLEAATGTVPLVKDTSRAKLGKATTPERCTVPGIISVLLPEGEFRSTETRFELEDGVLRTTSSVMELLETQPGAMVGVTPMTAWVTETLPVEKPAKRAARKAAKPSGGKRIAKGARA